MRIASLLPAATEWICAFGGGADLVARSHECDFPAAAQDAPVVTRPTYAAGGDSAAIDAAVQGKLQQGLSLYEVDLDRLRALRPDLILTQAQCEVCAVALPQLEAMLAEWPGAAPQLLSMEPMTFKQVLDAALRIGRAAGRMEAAMSFVAAKEKALRAFQDRLGLREGVPRPTVACIEWMEPLMTAGHWMPDLVAHAGGEAVLAEAGAPSRCARWEALRAADPDVLALMPCGFSLAETRRDLSFLTERDGWQDLKAVRAGRVYLFDGSAYFNRPGPRLYRSAELLAAALYPERLPARARDAEPWELRRLSPAGLPLEGLPLEGLPPESPSVGGPPARVS